MQYNQPSSNTIMHNDSKQHTLSEESILTNHQPTPKKITKTSKTFTFTQNITSAITHKNYIIAKGYQQIYIYDVIYQTTQIFPIPTKQFLLFPFQPYIMAVIIGQYFHMYPEMSLENKQSVTKVKISKLEIQCFCRYNKGYYMGGYNKSKYPGGKRTTRREIYYIEELNPQKNNKPTQTIQLPKNQNPVSIISVQKPYLVAYCCPSIFLISIQSKQILMKFQKNINNFILLSGRYASNTLNLIGLSQTNNLFLVDFEKQPIFGMEINEDYTIKIQSICQSCSGRIYISNEASILEYNPYSNKKTLIMTVTNNQKIIFIGFTKDNKLIMAKKKQNKTQIQIFNIQ